MKQVDIHEGLDNTLMILQNRLKPKSGSVGIQVLKEYHNPHLVDCYAGQLNQVFMNILVNAIDALEAFPNASNSLKSVEQRLQPAIVSATGNSMSAPSELLNYSGQLNEQESELWQSPRLLSTPPLPTISIQTSTYEDEWVEIRITDNGTGMPETVRQKVFDPFFTTKPVGQGTGLGMSISYQIVVEKHGGQLLCDSIPGSGTEFVIRIPIPPSTSKVLADDVARS